MSQTEDYELGPDERVALLWLEKAGFQGTDVSLETSLVEYGIARHIDTGLTILGKIGRLHAFCWDYSEWYTSSISNDEVLNAMIDASDGFFSFIGKKRSECILSAKANPDIVVHYISALNDWNGHFLRQDGHGGTSLDAVAESVAEEIGIEFVRYPERTIAFDLIETVLHRIGVTVKAEEGESTEAAMQRAFDSNKFDTRTDYGQVGDLVDRYIDDEEGVYIESVFVDGGEVYI